MNRFRRWCRLAAHDALVREARAAVHATSGPEFAQARDRLIELALCPDPMACDHDRPCDRPNPRHVALFGRCFFHREET